MEVQEETDGKPFTMYIPLKLLVTEAMAKNIAITKPGIYMSVDHTFRSIWKKFSFGSLVKLNEPSECTKLYCQGLKQGCTFLVIITQDLQNLLVVQTLIDCRENVSQAVYQQNNRLLSKIVGKIQKPHTWL